MAGIIKKPPTAKLMDIRVSGTKKVRVKIRQPNSALWTFAEREAVRLDMEIRTSRGEKEAITMGCMAEHWPQVKDALSKLVAEDD